MLSWGGEWSRERLNPAACFVTNSVFSPVQNRSRSREPDQGGRTVLSERRTFERTHRQGQNRRNEESGAGFPRSHAILM